MPSVTLGVPFDLSRSVKLVRGLPNVFLTYGTQREISYRIREVSFDEGVSERKVSGINNKNVNWRLSWTGLTSDQERLIREFFNSLKGIDYFVWAPFNETEEQQFIARGYESDLTSYQTYAASVQLIKVFDHE